MGLHLHQLPPSAAFFHPASSWLTSAEQKPFWHVPCFCTALSSLSSVSSCRQQGAERGVQAAPGCAAMCDEKQSGLSVMSLSKKISNLKIV